MAGELRPVFVARGDAEAHQIQSFLGATGIPSALRRGPAQAGFFSLTPRGLEVVTVLVDAADEEAALALLAEAEAGAFRLEEDDTP